MKEYQNKIRGNKDLFDDKELPEGHFERFEALLDKQDNLTEKISKKIRLITVLSVAATIAILISTGLYFNSISKLNDLDSNSEKKVLSEFDTTNEFYKQQMLDQIDNIMCKLDQADDETRKQLTKDIQSIINENKQFIDDMQKNDNEEVAIYYMVEHYKTNIQALQFINEKLGNHFEC